MYCCSAYSVVWGPSSGEVPEQFGWNGESDKPFVCTQMDDDEDGGEFEEVTFDHNRIWEYRTAQSMPTKEICDTPSICSL